MSTTFEVAYVPIGVPTFHLESAQIEFEKSIKMISEITDCGKYPEKMLLSIDALDDFLESISPDLLIVQNITFANAAYISRVLQKFDVPVLLWTLREPVIDGGRLRLNSLTGAYSAGNAMMFLKNGNFEYVFGGPEELQVKETVKAAVEAARLICDLRNLKICSIGHTPQGFGFGRALDVDMLYNFGVTLESIEARELIDKAEKIQDEDAKICLESIKGKVNGMDSIPLKNQLDFAKLYQAYKEYLLQNRIGAISSRCWPDFFTSYGTPVCAVLAMLNDMGLPSSCEADTYGALSMYMGQQLSGNPVFFGDPVSLDEEENTLTFWHCGTAACSLAREDTGACIGVHCNRKIGPTMEFGCKPGKEGTIFRVGVGADKKPRFFIASGEILDKPKQFTGTSIVVRTENNAKSIVENSVKDGWEPHFVIIYKDVKKQLEMLGHMLGIEIVKY